MANPVNIAIGAAVGTVGAVILAPVLAPVAVGILGFSAAGPVAGTSFHLILYVAYLTRQ